MALNVPKMRRPGWQDRALIVLVESFVIKFWWCTRVLPGYCPVSKAFSGGILFGSLQFSYGKKYTSLSLGSFLAKLARVLPHCKAVFLPNWHVFCLIMRRFSCQIGTCFASLWCSFLAKLARVLPHQRQFSCQIGTCFASLWCSFLAKLARVLPHLRQFSCEDDT